MSKRVAVITLASLLSLSSPFVMAQTDAKAKTNEQSAKAPRLTIIEPVKDYGTVPKGEKLDWTFLVKNTGDADLQIIAAKPGCGCTVAEFDKVVKPGQTGKVAAHVDTTNFAGPIAKAVTLETNDPSTPTAQLTIHAVVKPYVEAYPAGFVRFNLLQGDTDGQGVTLYSEEEEPFEIVKVETPQEWIKVDYAKIVDDAVRAPGVGRSGQNQYKLLITAGGPDAKLGPLAEKIRIVTNSKHQPEYFVSVSGVIRPTYRIDPTGVNFGEVSANETAATRTITLRSNDLKTPDRFVVTKVESAVNGVSADVKPTANKGEYEVTLQLAKDAKPGNFDGKVTIFTTDKIRPTVEIPIRGNVKAMTTASAAPTK